MEMLRKNGLHWTTRLAFGLISLAAAVRLCVLWFSHNYNVAAEANGLYGLLEVADGRSLYPSVSTRPLFIYLYTPLHAWVGGLLLRLTGITELREQVLVIRFISLVCFGGCLLLVTQLARQWFKVSGTALLVVLVLGVSKFTDYATSSRHDTFYCLLELSSLSCFLHFVSSKRWASYCGFLLFASLAVWTRQTGIIAFSAVCLWLVWERQWRELARTTFLFGAINAILVMWLYRQTGGAVLEHILFANVRGFRPVLSVILDFSFVSFGASYVLFAVLLLSSTRRFGLSAVRREVRLVLFAGSVAVVLASGMFLRAGGDVNYFFMGILLGMPLAAISVESWLRSRPGVFQMAFFGQAVVIAVVLLVKSYSAYETGYLPFESMAARIRSEIPGHGLLLGKYAQGFGIHLRGWAIHGPDVTNASSIASNGHPILREIEDELYYSMKRGEIPAVVVADPRCAQSKWLFADWVDAYEPSVSYSPWVCVFSRKKDLPQAPTTTAALSSH